MTSRVLGLVRDQVLAHHFGTGDAMDAYLVAFRLPSLLRDLFAEGAISAAFVPTFTRQLAVTGKPPAWRLGNLVCNSLLVVTGTLTLAGIAFATPLVSLVAGDFRSVPGKLELTITLARIMLPLLPLVAMAAVLMGMLNSLHHFFVPSLSPAMFNVATIVVAVAVLPFSSTIGLTPITLIALSTLIGGVAQVAIQWPSLRREGFRWQPVIDWHDPVLHRVLILMGPGTIGLAATQVNVFVNTWLATSQGSGAVSSLGYAFRIMYLPIGLFGVSIATAVLPTLSRHATAHDTRAMRDTITDGLSLMMMLNIPATAGLIVLATPIVRLLFEHGEFTPGATATTSAALQLYALGLVGYSVTRIASPTFYALGLNRVPVLVSAGTVLLNVALNLVLVRTMGFRGLALGTSIAALASGGTLFVLLRQQLGGINGRRLSAAVARIAVATAIMAGVAAGTHRVLSSWTTSHGAIAQGVPLFGAIGLALLALAAAAWGLRLREFHDAVSLVTRRVKPRP